MATDNEVFSALASKGFENNGAFCYGTWNGYAVSLNRYVSKLYYIHVAVRLDKATGALRKALRRATKVPGLNIGGVERVMKNEVMFSISFAKADDLLARFAERMDAYTAALRENGIMPADTCAVSGRAHPESLCLVAANNSVSYQPVCAAVVKDQNYQAQERVEANENSGNYVTGFIGALLGMIVGLIPNLLTIIYMEHIYSLLFMLVPLAAMFGYKLFRGKMNTVSIVIVILLSLVGVVLIPYLEIVFYLVRDYSVPFGDALKLTAEAFTDAETLSDLSGEFLQLLLFMGLGIFASWRIMQSKTNNSVMANSNAQLSSLRPNPAYAAFDSAQQGE